MKKRKMVAAVGITTACILLAGRICIVNRYAKLPEINRVAQGESVCYQGVEYQVTGAELWDYWDYFVWHEDMSHHQDWGREGDGIRLLIVEYRVTMAEENNALTLDIPITYANTCNSIDPFFTADLNPALKEGGVWSGETICIPYEIYERNLTEEQWRQVVENRMEYSLVLGTYPVRNELLVTEIQEVQGG